MLLLLKGPDQMGLQVNSISILEWPYMIWYTLEIRCHPQWALNSQLLDILYILCNTATLHIFSNNMLRYRKIYFFWNTWSALIFWVIDHMVLIKPLTCPSDFTSLRILITRLTQVNFFLQQSLASELFPPSFASVNIYHCDVWEKFCGQCCDLTVLPVDTPHICDWLGQTDQVHTGMLSLSSPITQPIIALN